MPTFYRVHAWIPSASLNDNGHPLYVHPGSQGGGRVDNPDHYQVLYIANTAAGAVAEVFADHHTWTPDLLKGPPYLSGSIRALSTIVGDPKVMELNDPNQLLAIGQRPSRIVTKNRKLTRAWALGAFMQGTHDGVSWWSYHDPDWASIGVWDFSGLTVQSTVPLAESLPAFVEARTVLGRPWDVAS